MDLLIKGKRVRLHPILVSDNGKPWQELGESKEVSTEIEETDIWSFHDQESTFDIIDMIKAGFKPNASEVTEDFLDIWLAIGKTMDLGDAKVLDSIVCKGEIKEFGWEKRHGEKSPSAKSDERSLRPTILLIEDDMLGVVESIKGSDAIKATWKEQIDARYQFFDSSIWYRMISLEGDDFYGRLEELLEELIQNNENKLYDTISAIESLELQQRLFLNSYLVDEEDGHAQAVVPFRFHSETVMKKRAREIEENLEGYRWGSVLIDDFLHQKLNVQKSVIPKISKGELIKNLLSPYCEILNYEDKFIDGTPLNWLHEGQNTLFKYQKTDIIILDYYLGENTKGKHLYGADLIKKFANEDDPFGIKDRRPHSKYWVFPIAVIETAYASHLKSIREKNILASMVLGSVVDPIATPHLFRFRFLNFLWAQLQTDVQDSEKILKIVLERISSKVVDIRSELKVVYPSLVYGLSQIMMLNQQNKGSAAGIDKSVFAGSVFGNQKSIDAFCIHLQSLVHFVGYGTGQDKAKIMRELWRLKDSMSELNAAESQGLKTLIYIGEALIKVISNHFGSMNKEAI